MIPPNFDKKNPPISDDEFSEIMSEIEVDFNSISKDSISKDNSFKDSISKANISKDNISKDNSFKDSISKKSTKNFLVGVSGGADSMYLSLLMNNFCNKHKIKLFTATVDHQLRKNSAKEAKQVGKLLAKHGIKHKILCKKNPPSEVPKSDILNYARDLRYSLLTQYASEIGVNNIFVAHNLQDLAENFFLRLGRGSGVDGLASMAQLIDISRYHHDGLNMNLLRPLLYIRRERIISGLRHHKQEWIDDPSNDNEDFSRIKIRKILPIIEDSGISIERIALASRNLSRARSALEYFTDIAISDVMEFHDKSLNAPLATINRKKLTLLPKEVGLRVLVRVISNLNGNHYKPRLEKLRRIYREMINLQEFRRQNFSNLIFTQRKDDADKIAISAEFVHDKN